MAVFASVTDAFDWYRIIALLIGLVFGYLMWGR
jgi:hypothetical protein